ncbi:MAG: glycosyltransferase [Bacteroidales bacterium]|nr:glycosyltransferase [Bacteroidales bacterium]
MIENRDIIAIGLQPWDLDIAFTLKYTAIEMSKKNRVLFINPPLQRSAWLRGRGTAEVDNRLQVIKGEIPDLFQYNENMWVFTPPVVAESINWIKSPAIFDFFNKMNEKRLAKEIKRAADQLDFNDYILFNDNSMIIGYYLKELLKPSFSIYLLRDAVTLVSYHARHGKRLEPKLIEKMDLMVANSDYFADFGRQFNPHSYMVGQGCDLSRYNDADGNLQIPEDLKGIKKPIVGYVGYLTTIRLDIEVLVHIAKSLPEISLVLVGPEDEDFINSELHEISNVCFLGRKDPSELAAYIKGFDVAINPQLVNPITDINYPLKIDEYLAMGKATVATKTTFMAYFKDYVHLPSNKEEYITSIRKALTENSEEIVNKRIAYASTHTWGNFVDKIYKHMDDVLKERTH